MSVALCFRHERRSSSGKRSGHARQHHRPHHTQERATQVQAETDTHLQEQGPQTRAERVQTCTHSHTHTCTYTHRSVESLTALALICRFGDDIPGMEGLGTGESQYMNIKEYIMFFFVLLTPAFRPMTDITVVCPWEAFGDMELSDLAKYGII